MKKKDIGDVEAAEFSDVWDARYTRTPFYLESDGTHEMQSPAGCWQQALLTPSNASNGGRSSNGRVLRACHAHGCMAACILSRRATSVKFPLCRSDITFRISQSHLFDRTMYPSPMQAPQCLLRAVPTARVPQLHRR